MSKRIKSTELIELAETHNLVLSIRRLKSSNEMEHAVRRALYHALCMTYCFNSTTRTKIREAMELE